MFRVIELALLLIYVSWLIPYTEVHRLLWEVDAVALWLMRRLPTGLALLLARKVIATRDHNEESSCMSCAAKRRILQAKHQRTTGPVSEYCSKCGLSMRDWPRYCANRVVQVNNRPPRKAQSWFKQLFWE